MKGWLALHGSLPRLRGRDREGAHTKIGAVHPLPNPPPQAGEGTHRARCAGVDPNNDAANSISSAARGTCGVLATVRLYFDSAILRRRFSALMWPDNKETGRLEHHHFRRFARAASCRRGDGIVMRGTPCRDRPWNVESVRWSNARPIPPRKSASSHPSGRAATAIRWTNRAGRTGDAAEGRRPVERQLRPRHVDGAQGLDPAARRRGSDQPAAGRERAIAGCAPSAPRPGWR